MFWRFCIAIQDLHDVQFFLIFFAAVLKKRHLQLSVPRLTSVVPLHLKYLVHSRGPNAVFQIPVLAGNGSNLLVRHRC
jgi:hypothetical protein